MQERSANFDKEANFFDNQAHSIQSQITELEKEILPWEERRNALLKDLEFFERDLVTNARCDIEAEMEDGAVDCLLVMAEILEIEMMRATYEKYPAHAGANVAAGPSEDAATAAAAAAAAAAEGSESSDSDEGQN
ncbi:uncharacterized protein LOC122065207 [Macadamia integrifolia]|uniref:uncharacterized protein LOC122065207 n=1 Tax=Macadamia integrifolia TaxID=60698 RepID=UPI001C4EB38C|nr:uncharacterized protein LOC122065207 [Macadamia integrifolia]XP_042484961.1 uncharacterized protein LOC122065207 [Macadamia integrifolia]